MRLRKLQLKDAPFMLEWMHDDSVVKDLQTNFSKKTIEDCRQFIKASNDTECNIHLAIVNDCDEYMGTVSLKNIESGSAEFAITVRRSAMGKGISKFGMAEIIKMGLNDLGLDNIYWCVSPENIRAVRFYDKNNYNRIDASLLDIRGGTVKSRYKHIYGIRKNEMRKEEKTSRGISFFRRSSSFFFSFNNVLM